MEPVWMVLTFAAASCGTLALGLTFRWVDRKVTAMVQWRVGPPWYQPGVDLLKLFGKEQLMPATARGTGFLLAPIVAVAATAAAAAILWVALLSEQAAFLGDLIVVVYLLVIPAACTIWGAAASGSGHAALGAGREMKLLLAYELPLLIAILVALAHVGWTFRLGELAAAQQAGRPVLMSVSGALALIVAVVCMQAKLGQVPFDLAEAECEIMSGVYVEYSGPALAMFLMARAMLLAVLPLLLIVVFWGGVDTLHWWGWPAFAGKYVVLVALVTLIRNTNPRLRIDQALRLFWFVLAPLAAAALALALIGNAKGWPWL